VPLTGALPAARRFAVFILATVTEHAFAPAQVAPPVETAPYEIVGKGVAARAVASLQLKSADLRLEIRNIVIGPGGAEAVPVPERAIMELRSGGVATTIDGQERERRIGDFWTMEKGAVMRVKNHAQASVIRAIYLHEGSR
jgi:hypothetical protein